MTDVANGALSHERALDLAADKIDFGLTGAEEASLVEHLEDCFDCKRFAEMMASDDRLLDTSITWEDADPQAGAERDLWDEVDGDDDTYEPSGRPPEPRSDDEDDESDVDAPAPGGDLSRDFSDRSDDGDDDDEDDGDEEDLSQRGPEPREAADPDDDEELDVTAIESDVDEIGKLTSDEPPPPPPPAEGEGDDDDEEHENAGLSPVGGDDQEPEGPAKLNRTHETVEQDEIDAVKAEIEAMSDEELGAVDEDGEDLMSACAADDVNKAAQENGAPAGDHVHQRAERAVQDDDGVFATPYGKVAVYRSTKGIRRSRWGNGTPAASASAAAQIRNAVLRSRTGKTGVERYQKRGRLDGKSLHKIAMKEDRLFKRNTSSDPGKFFVRVAVDVSGSMGGQPVLDASAVARALADATVGTPTVRLEIWAWSDPFTSNHQRYYGRGQSGGGQYCNAGVVKVWGRGMPTSEVFRLAELPMGGTPDAPVLDWMWRDMAKEARSDETPVVIMCSDGWGDSSLPKVIEQAVKHGVRVKNVALGNYVHEDDQLARFGRGNYVPWGGSMEATARPLADMILRMVTGQDA